MQTSEHKIIAVKHTSRRNGERTPTYWSITSKKLNHDGKIYCHWFLKYIPKRHKETLNKSPDDSSRFGLKFGIFKIILKRKLEFNDFGNVSFDNVKSIEFLEDETKLENEKRKIY